MAQIQCGLLVSGRAWCHYVSYTGGMPLYVKRVFRTPTGSTPSSPPSPRSNWPRRSMVADYEAAVAGRPTTERVIELEMVI